MTNPHVVRKPVRIIYDITLILAFLFSLTFLAISLIGAPSIMEEYVNLDAFLADRGYYASKYSPLSEEFYIENDNLFAIIHAEGTTPKDVVYFYPNSGDEKINVLYYEDNEYELSVPRRSFIRVKHGDHIMLFLEDDIVELLTLIDNAATPHYELALV